MIPCPYNDGGNNFQKYDNFGASLKLDIDLSGGMTFTSITAQENADGKGKGDIDGGTEAGPGFIPFQAVTEDQLKDFRTVHSGIPSGQRHGKRRGLAGWCLLL